MSEMLTYTVPDIHCEHCEMSIREEVAEVPGVDEVVVDVASKLVTVRGHELSDELVRAAIEEAGYAAA
jgi:copper chaperone